MASRPALHKFESIAETTAKLTENIAGNKWAIAILGNTFRHSPQKGN